MTQTYLITLDQASLENLITDCVDRALKRNQAPGQPDLEAAPYGTFKWFLSVFPVPESTARQKVAKGEIPGVTKIGKRLLFNKAEVMQWLLTNRKVTPADVEKAAEDQFANCHQPTRDHR
ncbi:hypothetical protein GCM10027299_09170 [Larkinella ripae]